MVQAIAIAIVVIGIAVYLALFFRGRKAGSEIIDELEAQADEREADQGEPEAESPFASIETSNTADDTAIAHDTSVTKNMTFEDKVGGETVVVEVPSKDTRKRRVAKKEAPAVKKVAKKMKPVSTADLIKALEEKIEKRTTLLKDLKLNTDTDATLKRYRSKLSELKAKIAETAITKSEPIRYMGYEKKPAKAKKSSIEKDEVIRVSSPGVPKKTTKKYTKKAPAKKPAKKTTKKSKKSAK